MEIFNSFKLINYSTLIFIKMKVKYFISTIIISLLFTAVTCNDSDHELILYIKNASSIPLIVNAYTGISIENGGINLNIDDKVFLQSETASIKDLQGFITMYDSVIVKSANDGSVLLKYINNNDPSDNEFWQVDNWEEVAIDGDIYEYTYEYTFTIDDDDF